MDQPQFEIKNFKALNFKREVDFKSELINLTSCPVVIQIYGLPAVIYHPSGTIARLRSKPPQELVVLPNKVPVYYAPTYEEGVIDDFPDKNLPHPDIIVSEHVADQIPFWYRGNVYFAGKGGVKNDRLYFSSKRNFSSSEFHFETVLSASEIKSEIDKLFKNRIIKTKASIKKS